MVDSKENYKSDLQVKGLISARQLKIMLLKASDQSTAVKRSISVNLITAI